MNLYLLFIIIVSLIGIKIFIKDNNPEYLGKENTTMIKGIFILFVFYSHLTNYVIVQHSKDFLMYDIKMFLGQLVVTLFLFYSGYGVYESIKNKGKQYVESMPKNRIFKTWFNFAIAVLTFLIVNLILKIHNPIKKIILSFVCWDGLGNSNWYILAILAMYIASYLSFIIFDKKHNKAILMTWLLSAVFILFMSIYKEGYWYNTVLCYPLGMLYSYKKKEFDEITNKNNKYVILLVLTFFTFLIIRKFMTVNVWFYELQAMLFTLLIVFISKKIQFKSKILYWFGNNLFWVYILQRLPMLVLKEIGFNVHAYRFALISFVITIILTLIYARLSAWLFKIFDKKGKAK